MIALVEYLISEECKNKEAFCVCHKCGKCGRKFKDGIMKGEGNTHKIDDGAER